MPETEPQLRKLYMREPEGERRVHIQVWERLTNGKQVLLDVLGLILRDEVATSSLFSSSDIGVPSPAPFPEVYMRGYRAICSLKCTAPDIHAGGTMLRDGLCSCVCAAITYTAAVLSTSSLAAQASTAPRRVTVLGSVHVST